MHRAATVIFLIRSKFGSAQFTIIPVNDAFRSGLPGRLISCVLGTNSRRGGSICPQASDIPAGRAFPLGDVSARVRVRGTGRRGGARSRAVSTLWG